MYHSYDDYQAHQDELFNDSLNLNESQIAYQQSSREHDNGSFQQDLDKLLNEGRFVVVMSRQAFCPRTDAALRHDDESVCSDFATRKEADDYKKNADEDLGIGEETRFEVRPRLVEPTTESVQFEQAFDEIPF